jgi:SAM-dependent methyltransferase
VDIGSGTGGVAAILQDMGKMVTPVDVADFHGLRLLNPVIYNGRNLPFSNGSFDTALLLMVMHHTPDPNGVFLEASRVAKEIVVIETSYTGFLNKLLTVLVDAAGNLTHKIYWSSYKTDESWRKFFSSFGFAVVASEKFPDKNLGLPFLHVSYYLRRL